MWVLDLFGRISIAGRLAIYALFAVGSIVAQGVVGVDQLEKTMMTERRAKLQATVETVHGVVASYGTRVELGELTKEEAQRQVKVVINGLRYQGGEYFWINDLEPRMVMHPTKPELDGQDLTPFADPDGKHLFVAFVDVVKAEPIKGGFVDYRWPKPGTQEPVRKLSYVKMYAPWGWVVGSGVYLDDVDAALAMEVDHGLRAGGANTSALLLFALVVGYSARRSIRGLHAATARLSASIANGRLDIREDPQAVSHEFRPVIAGMNATMEAFSVRFRRTSDYVASIGRGVIPPRITEECQGEFHALDESLNQCIDAVSRLVADARGLADAARKGDLSHRAKVVAHQGEFRVIIQGVNETLDAALSPIEEATRVLDSFARRDLRFRVEGEYKGEHARIKRSLNCTADSLEAALICVQKAVGAVGGAAGEIGENSRSVADGAGRQAQELIVTTQALTEMATATRTATSRAEEADRRARAANSAASEGTAAMQEMAAAMERIRISAQGTSEIIRAINEIAFQTNLLALNAAVEAARAGDAGRGFAVVAEEVRALALRSKEAARQTEELIKQSVKEAGNGATTSKHVSAKLEEIADEVTHVTGIVTTIVTTLRAQSAGVAALNAAVTHIDVIVQDNSRSSDAMSVAAEALDTEATDLRAVLGTFQLGEARPAPTDRVVERRMRRRDAGEAASLAS